MEKRHFSKKTNTSSIIIGTDNVFSSDFDDSHALAMYYIYTNEPDLVIHTLLHQDVDIYKYNSRLIIALYTSELSVIDVRRIYQCLYKNYGYKNENTLK
jgi:hypothetical protein